MVCWQRGQRVDFARPRRRATAVMKILGGMIVSFPSVLDGSAVTHELTLLAIQTSETLLVPIVSLCNKTINPGRWGGASEGTACGFSQVSPHSRLLAANELFENSSFFRIHRSTRLENHSRKIIPRSGEARIVAVVFLTLRIRFTEFFLVNMRRSNWANNSHVNCKTSSISPQEERNIPWSMSARVSGPRVLAFPSGD